MATPLTAGGCFFTQGFTSGHPPHRMNYIDIRGMRAMDFFTVQLDPATASFYQNLAECVGLPLEQVLSDALFKLAAELSLEALHRKCS